MLDATEAINKIRHLEKDKPEHEKQAAIAALEKKCELLRSKIKEQEATDVNKERCAPHFYFLRMSVEYLRLVQRIVCCLCVNSECLTPIECFCESLVPGPASEPLSALLFLALFHCYVVTTNPSCPL